MRSGDELDFLRGVSREEALARVRDLVREDDRSVAQLNEIDFAVRGGCNVGTKPKKRVERQGRTGEKRDIDVADLSPIWIHGRAEQKNEPDRGITGEERGGSPGAVPGDLRGDSPDRLHADRVP